MTAKPRLWTLAVAALSAIVISLLCGGVALAILTWRTLGVPPTGQAIMMMAKRPLGVALMALCQSTVFALAALLPALLGRTPFKERLALSLGPVRGARWGLLAGLTAFGAMMASGAFFNFALALTGGVPSESLEMLDQVLRRAQGGELLVLLFAVAVAAPLGEELFFRGYVQTRLVARLGPLWGVLLSAGLFALAHLDLMHSAATFAMGAVVGYAVLRSQSTWLSIAAHVVNNTLAVVTARLGEGMDAPPEPASAHALWGVGFAVAALLALRSIRNLTSDAAP